MGKQEGNKRDWADFENFTIFVKSPVDSRLPKFKLQRAETQVNLH